MVTDSPPVEAAKAPVFPERRVVLLGASNLIRGISTVVGTATQVWGGPLDVLAATGHGRSFGRDSRVFVRRLPAILECGLWDDLARRPPAATAGLITDIGNDILYGFSAEQIADWVRICLERLGPVCERIVVTELPLASVRELDRVRFLLMRKLLFPKSELQLADALASAEELNERVVELAARYGAHVVRPQRHWFGFDPIHIKLPHWPSAWGEIFSSWRDDAPLVRTSMSWRRWWRLRSLRPQRREWWGVEQHQPQPAARLDDGSLISFF